MMAELRAWSWYQHHAPYEFVCALHSRMPPTPGMVRHVELSSLDPRAPDPVIDDGVHRYMETSYRSIHHRHVIQPDPEHRAECEPCRRGIVSPVRTFTTRLTAPANPVKVWIPPSASSVQITISEVEG